MNILAGESNGKSVVAQLSFELGIDTDSLYKELSQFTTKADKQLTASFANTGKNMGKKLLAGLGFGAAIYELKNFAKSSIELGSNLTEVQNVVDTSFKTMNNAVNDFAKEAIYNFGLSETVAKKYMGTIGAMNNAFGFTEKASYDMAEAVTGLAGDVASFYNLESDEAFTKLKSIWTGETETLKDLGVVMTQTALDQYALNNGFGKTTAKMTEQEKVMLRFQYVTNALSDATGDFIKTEDSWANQTRVLSLRFESLKATMGQGFINLFTPILKGLNSILEKLSSVAEGFKLFTESITGTTSVTQGFANVAAGASNAAGSVDNITTSLQEAKRELAGFDKISKIGDETGSTSSGNNNSTDTGIGDTGEAAGEVNTMANSIAKALEPLRKLIEDWKIGDFFSVGGDVSDLVIQINDFISDAISSVDWNGLGKNVGAFLKGIKWLDVFKSIGDVIGAAIDGAIDFWFGSFEEAPFETAFITAIGLWKFTGISDAIVGKLNKKLGTTLAAEKFSFSSALNMVFKVGIAFEIGGKLGYDIGKMLMEAMNPQLESFYEEFGSLKDIGDYIFQDGFIEGLQDIVENLPAALDDLFENTIFGYSDDSVERLDKKLARAQEKITEFGNSVNITFDSLDTEHNSILELADKYYELSQKTALTQEDIDKLGEYKEALEDYGVNVEEYIKPGTNAWAGTNEELQEAINNTYAMLKINAASDLLTEAYKNQNEALIEYNQLLEDTEQYSSIFSVISKEIAKGTTSIDDLINEAEQGASGFNTLTGLWDVMDEIDIPENIKSAGNYDYKTIYKAAKAYKQVEKARINYNIATEKAIELEGDLIVMQEEAGLISVETTDEIVDGFTKMGDDFDSAMKSFESNGKAATSEMTGDFQKYGGEIKNQLNQSKKSIGSFFTNASEKSEITTTKMSNDVELFRGKTDELSMHIAGMDLSIDVNTDEGKAAVKELDELFDELEKERTTKVSADTSPAMSTVESDVPKINTKLGGVKNLNILASTSSAESAVANGMVNINRKLGPKTMSIDADISAAKQKAETLKSSIEASLKNVKVTLQVAVQEKIKDGIAAAINIGKAAKQGIGEITAHANGGFPEDGLFFANHGELVGKFSNGKTAVANNEQILTGIENATAKGIFSGVVAASLKSRIASPPPLAMTDRYSANENEIKQMIKEVVAQNNTGSGYTKDMLVVLKELLQLVRELNLDIVIDGKKLKDIIVDQINRHTQQTGVCEIQI